jgi:hypothetical protein
MRPAPPEPCLAKLDGPAARDGSPLPRPVDDEEREQDADEQRR